MGHEIVYCSGCLTQLRDADFKKETAYHLEGQAYCEECAGTLIRTLPEARLNALLAALEQPRSKQVC